MSTPTTPIPEPARVHPIEVLRDLLPSLHVVGYFRPPDRGTQQNGVLRWQVQYDAVGRRQLLTCDMILDPEREPGTPLDASRSVYQTWKECTMPLEDPMFAEAPEFPTIRTILHEMERAVRAAVTSASERTAYQREVLHSLDAWPPDRISEYWRLGAGHFIRALCDETDRRLAAGTPAGVPG